MPFFISEAELSALGGDITLVVSKADDFIKSVLNQLEEEKARSNAAEINAEQTCSLIEQKYIGITNEMNLLEEEKARITSESEKRSSSLKESNEKFQQLEIELNQSKSDRRDYESKISELSSMKKRLMDVIDRKDTEIEEKNSSISLYLEKISGLTNEKINVEEKLLTAESSVNRSKALLTRITQEKELLEQHNNWLKEELNSKTNLLFSERRSNEETISDLKNKLSLAENESKTVNESWNRSKDRIKELENRVDEILFELNSVKQNFTEQENHFINEVETAKKLASLYKETSEENFKKANELEGAIKSFDIHLQQKDAECEQKLNEREAIYKEYEKKVNDEFAKLNEELSKSNEEIKRLTLTLTTKDSNSPLLTIPSVLKPLNNELIEKINEERKNPPDYASLLSGTALAAALIKDGWTLTKMYERYEETSEALREKEKEYKELEIFFNQIVDRVEQNARTVLEEREVHDRLLSAYNLLESKLHNYNEEKQIMDYDLRETKANLMRKERELKMFEKELNDSHHMNSLYLKKIQELDKKRSPQKLFNENNKPFWEIKDLIEENSKLRFKVEELKLENDENAIKLESNFSSQLENTIIEHNKETGKLFEQIKEQEEMINGQKSTMELYKRLYEETQINSQTSNQLSTSNLDANYKMLYDSCQEELKNLKEESSKHTNQLQLQIEKYREESFSAKLEKARIEGDLKFLNENIEKMKKDLEEKTMEMESILRRNIEFSETITQYQHRLKDNEISVQEAEEKARKLNTELSIISKEKELISISDKRSSEEVEKLSSRVYKLKASLEAAQSTLEMKEASWLSERKKIEDDCNRYQREWAELKKEIEMEKKHLSTVVFERDAIKEELNKKIEILNSNMQQTRMELFKAESNSENFKVRCNELEEQLRKENENISLLLSGGKDANLNEREEILRLKDEFEKMKCEYLSLKENLDAEKHHAFTWKEIAQANENALTQLTEELTKVKQDADVAQQSFLRTQTELEQKIIEFEKTINEKELSKNEILNDLGTKFEEKIKELAKLTESYELSKNDIEERNAKIKHLEESNKESIQKWKESQANYERQVLMQGNTIRELAKVSEKLLELESNERKYLSRAELAEYELSNSKQQWESLKSNLEKDKTESDNKIKELEHQNRILLDRMEAMNISALAKASAEKDKTEMLSDRNLLVVSESNPESDLQEVIHYLRRSKETCETELSLMTQERSRILKQLESASKDAEEARNRLKSEQERLKSNILTEEEFKKLKLQVEQMSLLRESNHTLRLENERNYEECKKYKERVKGAEEKIEPLEKEVKEKEMMIEMHAKEIESLKSNCDMWQARVRSLLEKYHSVDLEEYDKMKVDLEENSKNIQELKQKLSITERHLSESNEKNKHSENELNNKMNEISILKQTIGEKEANFAKSSEKINELTSKFAEMSSKWKESEEKLKILSEKMKEKESMEEKFNTVNTSANDYKKKFESVRRIAIAKRKEVEELSKQKEEYVISNSKLNTEIEQLKKGIEDKEEDYKIALQNLQNAAVSAAALKEEKVLQGRIKTLQENFLKFRQRTSLFHSVLEKANLKFNEIQSKQAAFDLWIEEQKKVQGDSFMETSQKSELDKVVEEGEVVLKQTQEAFMTLENDSIAPFPPSSPPLIPPSSSYPPVSSPSLISILPFQVPSSSTMASIPSPPVTTSIALVTPPSSLSAPSPPLPSVSTITPSPTIEPTEAKKEERSEEGKSMAVTEHATMEKNEINEEKKRKDKTEENKRVMETERKLRERLLAEKAIRKVKVVDESAKKGEEERGKEKEEEVPDEKKKGLESEKMDVDFGRKEELTSEEKKEIEEPKPTEEPHTSSSRISRIRRINRPKFEVSSEENVTVTENVTQKVSVTESFKTISSGKQVVPEIEKDKEVETETEMESETVKSLEQKVTVTEIAQSTDVLTSTTALKKRTFEIDDNENVEEGKEEGTGELDAEGNERLSKRTRTNLLITGMEEEMEGGEKLSVIESGIEIEKDEIVKEDAVYEETEEGEVKEEGEEKEEGNEMEGIEKTTDEIITVEGVKAEGESKEEEEEEKEVESSIPLPFDENMENENEKNDLEIQKDNEEDGKDDDNNDDGGFNQSSKKRNFEDNVLEEKKRIKMDDLFTHEEEESMAEEDKEDMAEKGNEEEEEYSLKGIEETNQKEEDNEEYEDIRGEEELMLGEYGNKKIQYHDDNDEYFFSSSMHCFLHPENQKMDESEKDVIIVDDDEEEENNDDDEEEKNDDDEEEENDDEEEEEEKDDDEEEEEENDDEGEEENDDDGGDENDDGDIITIDSSNSGAEEGKEGDNEGDGGGEEGEEEGVDDDDDNDDDGDTTFNEGKEMMDAEKENFKKKNIQMEDKSSEASAVGRIVNIPEPIPSTEPKAATNLNFNLPSGSKSGSESMDQIMKRRASKFAPISPRTRPTASASVASRTRSKLTSPQPHPNKNDKEKKAESDEES